MDFGLGFSRSVTIGVCLVVAGLRIAAAQPMQQPAPPAQQPPAQATPQFQPSAEWSKLPKMALERQFAGPLQDTVIQRWRDPVDGTICYLYLPISAPHSPTTGSGFVQYGPNQIGTINCLPPSAPAATVAPQAPIAPRKPSSSAPSQ